MLTLETRTPLVEQIAAPRIQAELEPEPFAVGGAKEVYRGRYMLQGKPWVPAVFLRIKKSSAKANKKIASYNRRDFKKYIEFLSVMGESELIVSPKLIHQSVFVDPQGNEWIIMEDGGQSLANQKLRNRLSRDKVQLEDTLTQLLQKLALTHKRYGPLRDLKPANLLLNNEGLLTIIDPATPTLPKEDFLIGTHNYMPIFWVRSSGAETIEEERLMGLKYDYYAFFVIVYELYTGKILNPSESMHESLEFVVELARDTSYILDLDAPLGLVFAMQRAFLGEIEPHEFMELASKVLYEIFSRNIEA